MPTQLVGVVILASLTLTISAAHHGEMGGVQGLRNVAVTATVLLGISGCIQIPENDPSLHRDDPNSTRYEGLCICYARDDQSIRTMNPVTACDVPAKYVFYSNVEPKLKENCDLGDSQFTECYLAEVFTDPVTAA